MNLFGLLQYACCTQAMKHTMLYTILLLFHDGYNLQGIVQSMACVVYYDLQGSAVQAMHSCHGLVVFLFNYRLNGGFMLPVSIIC